MSPVFTFRKIHSPELLEEAFRLRYQVYCRERRFIPEDTCPEGYETDLFDEHAVHFGAFAGQEQMIGAVRLILPTCEKFPLESRCADFSFAQGPFRREACAEISRLTISRHFRRLFWEERAASSEPAVGSGEILRHVSPLTLGLCHALFLECRELGINHCFALMEKPLWMLLRLHGFVFAPVGAEIDYYGKVSPYVIDVIALEKSGLFGAASAPTLS